MNCPECGAEMHGHGNVYGCEYCSIQYRVDFRCEKCGSRSEYPGDETPDQFYCRSCRSVKSPMNMKKDFTEIGPLVRKGYQMATNTNKGYSQLLKNGSWKLGLINFNDEYSPAGLKGMSRYQNAESIYAILGENCAVRLILGGEGDQPRDITVIDMQPKSIYTVETNVWHCIIMEENDSLIQVTAGNGKESSYQYFLLDPGQKDHILRELKLLEVSSEISCF